MGVNVRQSKNTLEIAPEGTEARNVMRFADGGQSRNRFHRISAGIRPQDKLARQMGSGIAPRGGIEINDHVVRQTKTFTLLVSVHLGN